MLPDLRFLFVAVVLSLSMLIFGLGAAALLRSAHEEFASLPTRRAPPETVFAPPTEASRPTLALLRVEPANTDQSGSDRPAVANAAVPNVAVAPEPPSPIASTAAEPDKMAAEPDKITPQPDKVAALTPTAPAEEKSGPAEEKSQSSDPPADKSAETPAPAATPVVAAASPPETQKPDTPKVETQVAAIAEPASPAAAESTATASEPMRAPAESAPAGENSQESSQAASSKIATLGGPAATIDPQTTSKIGASPSAKSTAPSKRAQARHHVKRRRIARARVAPQPQPAPVGLFETTPPRS